MTLRVHTVGSSLATYCINVLFSNHRNLTYMLLVEMLNIVGERERPNFGSMFGLHNVLSAHSFPFVKQDVAVTCVL